MISDCRPTTTLDVRIDAAPSLDSVKAHIDAAFRDDRLWLCSFVNPASIVLAKRHADFRQMLSKFNMVLPDGTGTVMAVRWLHRIPVMRISFDTTSLAPHVFRLAGARNKDVTFVGGRPGVAEKAAALIRIRYRLRVTAYDGYSDHGPIIDAIVANKSGLVIAGMGSGRQERFLLDLAERKWRGVGITCGGYLDQLSAGYTYYPAIVDWLNLRFAYRLIKEPRRLWRRYLLEYPLFLLWLCHDLLRRNKL